MNIDRQPNKAINADAKKLRCAPLFGSGYGRRYIFTMALTNFEFSVKQDRKLLICKDNFVYPVLALFLMRTQLFHALIVGIIYEHVNR